MRRTILVIGIICLCVKSNFAQLSPYQKNLDFQELVALFDKDYAFIEWKKQAFGFDGLKLGPWMTLLNQSQDDLSYFEAATLYASSFQDSHTAYLTPSTFYAQLGFTVDVYSGKVLIDSIDRDFLPLARYPFKAGDELVSLDGRSAADWIALFTPFVNDASPVSRARTAAGMIVFRDQEVYPRSTEIGDTATVVISRQSGAMETYNIAWVTHGYPYQSPLLPDPELPAPSAILPSPSGGQPAPDRVSLRKRLRNFTAQTARYSIGVDDYRPFFNLPAGFTIHRGASLSDFIFSGSFQAGGYTIAYIRIPDFLYVSQDVQSEVEYFTSKVPTDGLIVDLMRNPGGDGCEAEAIASSLSTTPLLSLRLKERVTFADLYAMQQALSEASYFGTQEDIDFYTQELAAYQTAYSQRRGFTDPLPLCGRSNQLTPATNASGVTTAYAKPVMLLTDELTASSAEILASVIQDNKAGLIYGNRTNGAGGSVESFSTGSFTEGYLYMARSILMRGGVQSVAGLPSQPYIENFGVQPDIVADYMTGDNLINKGQTFVDGFTSAMVNYIKSKSIQ